MIPELIEPQKGKAMKRTGKRHAITTALVWELCWVPVEMACVGLGLWLSLKLLWMTVGSLWLLAFLAIDSMVRYQHYSKVAPAIHGPQLEQ